MRDRRLGKQSRVDWKISHGNSELSCKETSSLFLILAVVNNRTFGTANQVQVVWAEVPSSRINKKRTERAPHGLLQIKPKSQANVVGKHFIRARRNQETFVIDHGNEAMNIQADDGILFSIWRAMRKLLTYLCTNCNHVSYLFTLSNFLIMFSL